MEWGDLAEFGIAGLALGMMFVLVNKLLSQVGKTLSELRDSHKELHTLIRDVILPALQRSKREGGDDNR